MIKKRIRITDGGVALPLGNNTFLMRGRLHSQGGIGIGNGGKNDIEVEDGEVVKFNKDNIQVLSDQPMLNGISPANALLAGGNFNKIFKAQQSINGNYGGSYAENGTKYTYIGGTPEESRKKYYEIDTKLTDAVNAIAKEYGIAPELLFHRLAKEGIIDGAIQDNNIYYFMNEKYNQNNEFVSIMDRNYFSPFGEIGLDDGFSHYDNYDLKRNIPVVVSKAPNEFDRIVHSVETTNLQNAIELMAADLNYRKNILAKNGINPTNALISASYNRGLDRVINSKNKEYLEKEYSIPNIYNSLIRDVEYKPDDRVVNEYYENQIRYNLEEMNDAFLSTHKRDKNNRINYFNNNYKNYFKGIDEETINNILKQFLEFDNGIDIETVGKLDMENNKHYNLVNDILSNNDAKKLNTSYINSALKLKNGGQINMKLKNKNKQDITDIVMNEILPPSTGKRKKFFDGGVWGATDFSLLGNTGLNFLSTILQGTIGSINAGRVNRMYNKMKRTSTYIPVAREHINTKVDVEPQLSGTKLAEQTLINNAQANTSNSKVARQQVRDAVANRIVADNQIYGDKFNKETALRNAEAELQTQYNLVDNQNKLADIREQNEFDMMKAMGKANAKTAGAQTWGTAIANGFKNIGQTLTDYATMKNDLLKSDNSAAYEEKFKFEFGHLKNKLSDPEWVAKNKDWIDANIGMITKLGWAKSNMKGSYDKSLTPYIGAFLK